MHADCCVCVHTRACLPTHFPSKALLACLAALPPRLHMHVSIRAHPPPSPGPPPYICAPPPTHPHPPCCLTHHPLLPPPSPLHEHVSTCSSTHSSPTTLTSSSTACAPLPLPTLPSRPPPSPLHVPTLLSCWLSPHPPPTINSDGWDWVSRRACMCLQMQVSACACVLTCSCGHG